MNYIYKYNSKIQSGEIATSKKQYLYLIFLASIDEFSWGMDRSDNINYEIELTEFPERLLNFWNRDKNLPEKLKNTLERKDKLKRIGLLINDIGY